MAIDYDALQAALAVLRPQAVRDFVQAAQAGEIPCSQIEIKADAWITQFRPYLAGAIKAYEAAKASEQPKPSGCIDCGHPFNGHYERCRWFKKETHQLDGSTLDKACWALCPYLKHIDRVHNDCENPNSALDQCHCSHCPHADEEGMQRACRGLAEEAVGPVLAAIGTIKRESGTLTAADKYDIAESITTESRSKTDVVQDVFDELAQRFDIRRKA